MYKRCRLILLVLLALHTIVWSGNSYANKSREYQLKAAYLLNFARFVYWPEQVFQSKTDGFNICIYGENPFGENLDRLANKTINNRKITLKYSETEEGLKSCHILFVSQSKEENYKLVIENLENATILTVSDIEGFGHSHGMIEFVRVKNKIKFEINVDKSTQASIKYRSQLLEVAEQLR